MKRFFAAVAVWLGLGGALLAWDTKADPTLPNGKTLQLPLPASEHMMNTGGSDGAGLCVYTSVTLSAHWHNITDAYNLRKFAEGRPGGSYPEKLASDLKTYSLRYNVTLPTYVQHTGGDDSFLDLCMKTRRYPGITYAGQDDFYRQTIAHMVNLVNLDANYGTIQDNNRAGKWTTGTRSQLLNRWKGLDDNGRPLRLGGQAIGGGWAFVWIAPPAPPMPPKAADPITVPEPVGRFERIVIGDAYKAEGDERGLIVWAYWLEGELVGGFHKGKFYSLVVREEDGKIVDLGEEKAAPRGVCPPCHEVTEDDNKGIVLGMVSNTRRYWINETEVSRTQAYAQLLDTGDGLVDDSDKYHLSFVGADKKAILALFASGGKFEKYARRLHVQVYTSDAWPARTILSSPLTLQEPASLGGKVVRVSSLTTEDAIQKTLSSVFDPPPVPPVPVPPSPVPDPSPNPSPPPGVPAWLWALGGALLALIYRRKN